MRVAIIGAGPTGLFLGATLQRRGHAVTVVDRGGTPRVQHPQPLRGPVARALSAELPEALDRWVAMGAEPVAEGVRSRGSTFAAALRQVVAAEPGLRLVPGPVRTVRSVDGVAIGLDVDGAPIPAELVLDASGRSGAVAPPLGERAGFGGTSGLALLSRAYRLTAGATPGPLDGPLGWRGEHDGYRVVVVPHEHGHFSVLLEHPAADRELARLQDKAAFSATCRAIPALAAWTDPRRAVPCAAVVTGGEPANRYRGQYDASGRPLLTGYVAVGDAVGTTTPGHGRGVALALGQARALLAALDAHGDDVAAVADRFDGWCAREIAPWVRDHVEADAGTLARWQGAPLDPLRRLPSDLVVAASTRTPGLVRAVAPYLAMQAGPGSLDALQDAARTVYETGWRPPYAEGPTRDELVRIVSAGD